MGRLDDINDERNTLWNRGICYGVENYLSEISATLAMICDKMNEKKAAIDKSDFSPEQYKTDLQSAYDCGYNKALSENKGELIDTNPEENEDQVVGLYCTDCPYFQFTGEPSADWYGTRCNKDNHEASPSMYAILSLHDDCPLNRGVSE